MGHTRSTMPKGSMTDFLIDFAAGGVSGAVSKTLTAPIERVKLVIQTQDANPKIKSGEVPRYTGIGNCFTRIYSEQGMGAFWRGNGTRMIDSTQLESSNTWERAHAHVFQARSQSYLTHGRQAAHTEFQETRRPGAMRLILLALLLTLVTDGVNADLFVVFLEGSKIFASLGELALLHALTDVPVDEGALGVHEVELVVKTSPGLGNGRGVAEHADRALDLGQVTTGHDSRGLVVDADLETSGAPVDELDGTLGLDGGDGGVDVLGDDVATVEHAAGHVLAVAGVALHHLVGRLAH